MKRGVCLLAVFLLIVPYLMIYSSAEADDGYWTLKETFVDEENSKLVDDIAKENETYIAYSYKIYPGGGSMSTTTDWFGSTYTVKAAFSFKIPEKIKSGEKFNIELKVWDDGSDNPDAHISHNTGANAYVKYGDSWSSIGRAGAWTQDFQLRDNPPASAMKAETVTELTAPGKEQGFCIWVDIMAGSSPGALKICYNYEYIDNSTSKTTESKPKTEVSKNPDLKDAGCVFSDLGGQVEVLNPIGYDENGEPQYDEEDWHFAKIDEPRYVGTKIKTGSNYADNKSMAIISFADMSTFVLQESTTIELVSPTKKESKIKLAMGNIWANVKKMVKDGTMDVEMSQAVAGIKGTIFVCEVKSDGTSTLKVIEGEVQFTEKATAKTATVNGGEMIAAGPQAVSLTKFDIKAEHKKWLEFDPNLPITNKNNIAMLVVLSVSAAAVIVVLIFAFRKKYK
ncbi:MAG: FecR family protein [Eubacteriales bacterium]|nr:FecR family protein [Eubacteriales bacterium]MDD4474315.1 FecR family protein [Eubacteriales bacterium]